MDSVLNHFQNVICFTCQQTMGFVQETSARHTCSLCNETSTPNNIGYKCKCGTFLCTTCGRDRFCETVLLPALSNLDKDTFKTKMTRCETECKENDALNGPSKGSNTVNTWNTNTIVDHPVWEKIFDIEYKKRTKPSKLCQSININTHFIKQKMISIETNHLGVIVKVSPNKELYHALKLLIKQRMNEFADYCCMSGSNGFKPNIANDTINIYTKCQFYTLGCQSKCKISGSVYSIAAKKSARLTFDWSYGHGVCDFQCHQHSTGAVIGRTTNTGWKIATQKWWSYAKQLDESAVIKRMVSDCELNMIKNFCDLFNGINLSEYIKYAWQKFTGLDETNKKLFDLIIKCMFIWCSTHVINSTENHYQYNDKKLKKNACKTTLIYLAKRNLYNIMDATTYKQIIAINTEFSIFVTLPTISLKTKTDITDLVWSCGYDSNQLNENENQKHYVEWIYNAEMMGWESSSLDGQLKLYVTER